MTDRYGTEAAFGLASYKAATDDDTTGEFEALVSVFGNVDLGGDRVMPGAFTRTLKEWEASGDPIPVIWNHQWDNPLAHIGEVRSATETPDGLLIKGTVDTHNEFARQVHHLLSARRVKEFSFGYNVRDGADKDGAYELRDLDLIEVGPTLKGMNPATQLLAVKSYSAAEAKAGRALVAPLSPDDRQALERVAGLLTAQVDAATKSAAGLSDETRAAIEQASEMLASLNAADLESPEQTGTTDAEAPGGKASGDPDLESLVATLALLKEENHRHASVRP